ncbi:MAG: glycosyltransferase family 39 protein [Anaerolineae bacterium]|jgi:hypothetical protein|nr:glycosyltransferase family 39 protein [Anaerolineae bacterium]MDH7473291.1 glycosyltransferase family 39 protein [Anaerolineae bacterium]
MKSSLITWRVLWIAILIVLVLFLALYNLEHWPPTWFDEGVHLLAAKKLALEGKYRFGPALGPTVFFPIAAAFRVAGVSLLPARVVMVGYLLLCLAAFYTLARSLGGWKVATAGTLLLISSPGVNILRWGRQALGEVPATLFFLAGILLWIKALNDEHGDRRRGELIFSGVLLGLAILTKNQFLLLVPAWVLLWITNKLYYHQAPHSTFVLPLFSAIVCVLAWYVGQKFFFPAGGHLFTHNVQEWSNALSRGIITISPRRALDAIKFLISQDTFYAWVLPGVLYAALLAWRRSKEGLQWALLAFVVVVWLGWFITLSVGWPRYAFLPLVVAAIFIAQFFHDWTGGYRVSLGELWRKIRLGHYDPILAGRVILTALFLLMVMRPLQGRFTEVISGGADAPQRMAAYIVAHLPPDAEIETYDPEVCFLSGYDCHFPPSGIMDAAIEYVWYNAPPPSEHYDFRQYGARYLLIGEFGRWTHVYAPEVVEEHYDLVVSIGGYELYEERTE